MAERELTPDAIEAAADYLKAEIERRLIAGKPITRATLSEAALAAWDAIAPPRYPPIRVERDPADPSRMLVYGLPEQLRSFTLPPGWQPPGGQSIDEAAADNFGLTADDLDEGDE